MTLVFYQTFALPFNLAFYPRSNDSESSADWVIDILFVIDMLLNFNVALPHPEEPSRYITNRTEIAKAYMKGWFAIDLLACIPFDKIALRLVQDGGDTDNLQAFGLLKGLRLPRLLRLVRLLRVLKMLRINPGLKRWLQYSRHANLLRLFRLVVMFLVVTHFMACIWEGIVVSGDWKAIHVREDGVQHTYYTAFFACVLLVMGENIEPISNAEMVFSSFALLLGAVVMAIAFGNVAVLIANFTADTSAHQKKVNNVGQECNVIDHCTM